jgi:hypothetical protein
MHWLVHHGTLAAAIAGCLFAVSLLAIAPVPILREPIVFTRGHLLAIALLLGFLGAGGILLLDQNSAESTARRQDLKAQLERERHRDRNEALTKAEVRVIARRQARLERPDINALLAGLRRAARLCRAHQAQCVRAARAFGAALTQPAALQRPAGASRPVSPPARPPRRRAPPRRPRPAPTAPAPGGEHAPPPATPPSPARPPASVTLQPTPPLGPIGPITPPSLCSPVIDVNCPRP